MNKIFLFQSISVTIFLLLVSLFLDFLIVGETIRYDVLAIIFWYLLSLYYFFKLFKNPKPDKLKVQVVNHQDSKLTIPEYATPGSAGVDLRAYFTNDTGKIEIKPGEHILVKTGISVFINDPSCVAIVLPRSGLSLKHSIGLKNFVGVIDSDYQNEIGLALWNHGTEFYELTNGDRVAQMLFLPVIQPELIEVASFNKVSSRGLNGWGHSGTK